MKAIERIKEADKEELVNFIIGLMSFDIEVSDYECMYCSAHKLVECDHTDIEQECPDCKYELFGKWLESDIDDLDLTFSLDTYLTEGDFENA